MHCIFWRLVQYLSQSVSHPVQEWPWLYRNVRFCGGVIFRIIVINDKLVCVLGERLSTHGFPRSCSQLFTRFPLLRRPLVVNVPFWIAHHKSPCSWLLLIKRAQRYLTFKSCFPRAFWCSRGKHVRIPYTVSWYQIHHRLWLCCDSLFTWIFLRSFRHHFRTIGRTEIANVKQTQKMIPSPASSSVLFDISWRLLMELKWLMLNKHKWWFHSSRVKFPFVSMSASWFLVSKYLMWILSVEQPIKSNSVGSGNM